LAEFLAEGLNGANIESIARKACVGKSTIYRKYLSKQGLLLAVAQRRMKELEERWQEFPFDIKDPENTLYRIAFLIPIELDEEARSQLARDAVQFFLYGYAKRNKKS
jgi:AcrR family transcriptional regulator